MSTAAPRVDWASLSIAQYPKSDPTEDQAVLWDRSAFQRSFEHLEARKIGGFRSVRSRINEHFHGRSEAIRAHRRGRVVAIAMLKEAVSAG